MSGLYRFDFYPRDWLTGTQDLSDRARGLYITLIAAMYDLGKPLSYDERYLRTLGGYGSVRSLRHVLRELLDKGKVRVENGLLVNDRVMSEIAKAQAAIRNGKKGGRPRSDQVQAEYEPNTSCIPLEKEAGIVEDQSLSNNPSSSTSSKKKDYRFQGEVICLTESDFDGWKKAYHAIPDIVADLYGLDDWWNNLHPLGDPKHGEWWFPIRGALNKKHQNAIRERKAADTEQYQPKQEWEEEFELMRSQGRLDEWLEANRPIAQKTGTTRQTANSYLAR